MINYRQAQPGDEVGLADLHNVIIKDQYGPVYGAAATDAWASHQPDKWLEFINSDQSDFFIATDNEKIIGAAGLNIAEQRLGVYVAQDYQRQGIAKILMVEQLRKAKALGLGRLDLSAPKMAVPFYTSLGFDLLAPAEHEFNNGAVITVFNMKIDL